MVTRHIDAPWDRLRRPHSENCAGARTAAAEAAFRRTPMTAPGRPLDASFCVGARHGPLDRCCVSPSWAPAAARRGRVLGRRQAALALLGRVPLHRGRPAGGAGGHGPGGHRGPRRGRRAACACCPRATAAPRSGPTTPGGCAPSGPRRRGCATGRWSGGASRSRGPRPSAQARAVARPGHGGPGLRAGDPVRRRRARCSTGARCWSGWARPPPSRRPRRRSRSCALGQARRPRGGVYTELVDRPHGHARGDRRAHAGARAQRGRALVRARRATSRCASSGGAPPARTSGRGLYHGRVYVTIDRRGGLAVVNAVPENRLLDGPGAGRDLPLRARRGAEGAGGGRARRAAGQDRHPPRRRAVPAVLADPLPGLLGRRPRDAADHRRRGGHPRRGAVRRRRQGAGRHGLLRQLRRPHRAQRERLARHAVAATAARPPGRRRRPRAIRSPRG